jgi:hypothetical protein
MTKATNTTGDGNVLRLDESDFQTPAGKQPTAPSPKPPQSAPSVKPQPDLHLTEADFPKAPASDTVRHLEITEADLRQVAEPQVQPSPRPTQGRSYHLTEKDFEQQPPVRPTPQPSTPPRTPPPSVPVVPNAATIGAATKTATVGSSWAVFFKALALFVCLGAAGTAGFIAVKEYGLLDGITMIGASPSAVVKEYIERSDAGNDVSSLLTEESKGFYARPGSSGAMAKLKDLMGNNKEGQQMLSEFQQMLNTPEFQKMQRAVQGATKKSGKKIKSERIEGDKAWVLVETEDPMSEYFAKIEAQIEYNRRHGQEEAARINEGYMEEKKRQIEQLGGQSFMEGMRNMEQPILCKREGGRWKVDLAGQMNTTLQNLEGMFQNDRSQ